MDVDKLPILYPLDPKAKNYFMTTFSTMKDVLSKIVSNQTKKNSTVKTERKIFN
jgi:hypothetical protein